MTNDECTAELNNSHLSRTNGHAKAPSAALELLNGHMCNDRTTGLHEKAYVEFVPSGGRGNVLTMLSLPMMLVDVRSQRGMLWVVLLMGKGQGDYPVPLTFPIDGAVICWSIQTNGVVAMSSRR